MSIILGLKLKDRQISSPVFQKIITKFGCNINTRLGLSQNKNNNCNRYGIILLEITNLKSAFELEKELLTIDEIEIQRMIFED